MTVASFFVRLSSRLQPNNTPPPLVRGAVCKIIIININANKTFFAAANAATATFWPALHYTIIISAP